MVESCLSGANEVRPLRGLVRHTQVLVGPRPSMMGNQANKCVGTSLPVYSYVEELDEA